MSSKEHQRGSDLAGNSPQQTTRVLRHQQTLQFIPTGDRIEISDLPRSFLLTELPTQRENSTGEVRGGAGWRHPTSLPE